jgi:hypothetical protein
MATRTEDDYYAQLEWIGPAARFIHELHASTLGYRRDRSHRRLHARRAADDLGR